MSDVSTPQVSALGIGIAPAEKLKHHSHGANRADPGSGRLSFRRQFSHHA
jgi:hypothetical protein